MNRFGQKAANCGIAYCRAWENTEKEFFEISEKYTQQLDFRITAW
jgi:hypothetical protein